MDFFSINTNYIFSFLLSLIFSVSVSAQCPDQALQDNNGTCMTLSWDTPPNPLPLSVQAYASSQDFANQTLTTYNYQVGSGTSADPAEYLGDGQNCNASDAGYPYTLVVVGGDECNYDANGNLIGVLPLQFMDFKASLTFQKLEVALSFNTESPVSILLEKSKDGISWVEFYSPSEIYERGDHAIDILISDYNYTSSYIRVKSIDENGFESLSPVKRLLRSSASKLLLYPNPVQDELNIDTNQKIDNVVVFNSYGSIVFSSKNNAKKIDLSSISPGSYIVQILLENGDTISKSLIK